MKYLYSSKTSDTVLKIRTAFFVPLAALVITTSLTVPSVAHAGESIEVLHHWVSDGEVKAVNVIRKALEAKVYVRVDSAVGGMTNSLQALQARITSGNPPAAMQFAGWDQRQWAEQGVLQLTVLEAAHDMVEHFQCSRHLQTDEIMTDTVDHRRNGVEGRAHGRFYCARTLPTAS